ncbi:hypothetical protein AARAC_002571 [Aspergillus arachidicola]|uniref:Peptidase metallopeptidase domain-containing protein n=1 Tax=Aspergillus arachidicola TaxID=656916 RepID=A0A2G7G8J6_9EURO|nr:hypothetical protein AARAC_002571 [Aspergillus arachidicola]
MATGFVVNLLFLLSLFFASLSNAGHSAWEAGATTVTSEWIHMDPSPEFRTWKDQTIRYAFNSPETKENLEYDVRAAWSLWLAAGLPETYKFVETTKARCDATPDDCLMEPHRAWDRIAMYLNFEGKDEEWIRALMITHEIGHAWGLIHEHQNPLLWQFAYRETRPDSLVQFYCANVQGYDEVARQFSDTLELWSENGPCRNQDRALDLDFRAADILPWAARKQQPHRLWPLDTDVDWESIMIYESHTFGELDEHGVPKLTLVRTHDLQEIPEPLIPTQLDVNGLQHLYHPVYGKFREVFHNDPDSPWYGVFKEKITSCLIRS